MAMRTRASCNKRNARGLSRGSLCRGLRWLLPGVLPLGVLLTHDRWGYFFGSALLASLIGSLCFGLFLLQVRELTARTLMPILVSVVLLIAYPLKVYFIAAASWDAKGLGALDYVRDYVSMLSPETLFESYEIGIIGMSIFFLMCFMLLPLMNRHPRVIDWSSRVNRRRLTRLLWILIVLSTVVATAISLTALYLGVLRFGVEPKPPVGVGASAEPIGPQETCAANAIECARLMMEKQKADLDKILQKKNWQTELLE